MNHSNHKTANDRKRTKVPTLIVTVDTEEEGLWSGRFRACDNTVHNIRGVRRFQALCEGYGVRPTYLVDTPVVDDRAAVESLKPLQDLGLCEIGAHLHPWCAPPFEERTTAYHSFMCNLSPELQREKLTRLTDSIEHRFGRRPTSFRAGRYGLDIVGARILEDLGYVVDSSVISFCDYSRQGGPDFRSAPFVPYRVGTDDLCVPAADGRLLEVPVSTGFSRANFARAQRISEFGMRRSIRRLRMVGALDRLNLVCRIKFSPEQADARRMKQLIRAYVANGAPAMVMMLHSSSLTPGGSPYVRNLDQLNRFYAQLDRVFAYCTYDLEMPSQTLTEFARSYMQADTTVPTGRTNATRRSVTTQTVGGTN